MDSNFPSFQEYCSKRDYYREKYLGKSEDIFTIAESGGTHFRKANAYQKMAFEINGHRVNKPEEAQRLCAEMGINPTDLRMVFLPQGGGKFDVVVKLMTAEEIAKRESHG